MARVRELKAAQWSWNCSVVDEQARLKVFPAPLSRLHRTPLPNLRHDTMVAAVGKPHPELAEQVHIKGGSKYE